MGALRERTRSVVCSTRVQLACCWGGVLIFNKISNKMIVYVLLVYSRRLKNHNNHKHQKVKRIQMCT